MRKKNFILLIIICILSLCFLAGLMAYAFDIQSKKDSKNNNISQTEETQPNVSLSPVPTAPAASSDSNQPDQNQPTEIVSDNTNDINNEQISVTPTPVSEAEQDSTASEPIVLSFAGDVNLDEASYPVKKYDSAKNDITKCLSKDLLKEMNDADIMMLNNEFAYSTRGSKTPDKSYTFRANPSRVDILKKMGVDIVSLANNHALDYGQDALSDTFTTLDNADIDYIGAGENLARARAPIYYTINGKKIAYVAASRVVFAMNWYAAEDRPGMVGTYDPALILETIKEAKENSDYVVYLFTGELNVRIIPKNTSGYLQLIILMPVPMPSSAVILM
jgi:poly-gamma-glutamate synthesis protein (capsule biosynthesis protein)